MTDPVRSGGLLALASLRRLQLGSVVDARSPDGTADGLHPFPNER